MSEILAGATIVEAVGVRGPLALSLAAGLCGRIAADLGARVIRLDCAGEAAVGGSMDLVLHSGKERIAGDTTDFDSKLAKIACSADCLVLASGLPSIVDSHGCDASIVELAMSLDDPLGGSEFTLEARSGLLDILGDPDRQPLRIGGHQIPYSAGIAAYLGVISSLTNRAAGSPRATLRVDLLDVAVWVNWKMLAIASRSGAAPSRKGANAEWTVIDCRDGHVALVYRAQDWPKLVDALGDSRLKATLLQTPSGRRENRTELNALLGEAFERLTRSEIRKLALALTLPLGPVWAPQELLRDPHMIDRGFFHEVTFGGAPVYIPVLPVKWNGRRFSPALLERAQIREAMQ